MDSLLLDEKSSPKKNPVQLDVCTERREFFRPYLSVWPTNVLARWLTSDKSKSEVLRRGLTIAAIAVQFVIQVLLTFICGYLYAGIHSSAKAVFESYISANPSVGALAPLVYGLVRAGTWWVLFEALNYSTGGFLMLWDTLVFAAHGWIRRDPSQPYDWRKYAENLLMAAVYVAVLLFGAYLGALTANYFVKDAPLVGAPVPENSLSGRASAVLFMNFGATALFVWMRMWFGNPFVRPRGSLIAAALFISTVCGGYIGNTGAVDLLAPLGAAFVAGRYTLLCVTITGQFLGAFVGVLLFHTAALNAAIEARTHALEKSE